MALSLDMSRDRVNDVCKKFALDMRGRLYLVFKPLCYVNTRRIPSEWLEHYNDEQKTMLADLVILLLNAVLPAFGKEGLQNLRGFI